MADGTETPGHHGSGKAILRGVAEPNPLTDLDQVLAAVEVIVVGIRDDQWAAPTSCTDLEVLGVSVVLGPHWLIHPGGNLTPASAVRRGIPHRGPDKWARFRFQCGITDHFPSHGTENDPLSCRTCPAGQVFDSEYAAQQQADYHWQQQYGQY